MGQDAPTPEDRLISRLGIPPDEAKALKVCLTQGQSSRRALVLTPRAPEGYIPPGAQTGSGEIPLWIGEGIYPVNETVSCDEDSCGAPGDYAEGYYYPLDLSSVWETAPLSQLPPPQRCLDMCAAPGGKSILAQARLRPGLHISNEIHPKRLGIMRHNLSRCGFFHMFTQRLRPDQWAAQAPECFDLILVDAPCSGHSMLAKGIPNPGCFHTSTISGNAKRQRGILLCALKTLSPGGHLLYTTCTYAPEENEKTVAWLLKRNQDMYAVETPALARFQVPSAPFPCFRLLPTAGLGAGGFTCLLAKKGSIPSRLPEIPEELLAWPVRER